MHSKLRTYINNYSRVKPENIIKLKYYMHNRGRSQGQIFSEANTLITCPVGYVRECIYGDQTS